MEVLLASPRNDLRKSVRRSLRNSGKIPAVVYGKTVQNTPVHVEEKDFLQLVRSHGSHAVLKLMWGEGNATVIINEVQQDSLKNNIVHIDFKEVNMNQEIQTEANIELVGEAEGVKQGGVLQKQYHTLEIRCMPGDIPDQLEVDISALGIGDSLTVGEINLPKGVEAQLADDAVIVSVLAPTLEEEADEPQIDENAEPELVDPKDGPGIDEHK